MGTMFVTRFADSDLPLPRLTFRSRQVTQLSNWTLTAVKSSRAYFVAMVATMML